MLTARGKLAIWHGIIRMWTANEVVRPPNPCGPIPSLLISVSISDSNFSSSGSGFLLPRGLSRLFFARRAACSKVPPIPTPTIVGGHGFEPDSLTLWTTYRLMPFDPVGGSEHHNPAHILAAAPFGCYRNLDLFSRNDFRMDNRRGIVPGICPRERMADRLPQISVPVPLTNPFKNGFFQVSSNEMNILSQFHEYHCKTRILADGNLLLFCNPGILFQFSSVFPPPAETPPSSSPGQRPEAHLLPDRCWPPCKDLSPSP